MLISVPELVTSDVATSDASGETDGFGMVDIFCVLWPVANEAVVSGFPGGI